MIKPKNSLRIVNIVLGMIAILSFVYSFLIFTKLQPKMVNFDVLTPFEDFLISGLGLGLLMLLLFYLLSLLQMIRYVKHAEKINPFSLFLIISVVLCVLFVFSDWALLSDIHKQYRHQLPQPEWTLLYPIMGAQFLLTILFEYLQLSGFFVHEVVPDVARDINIFLILQYVGVICGLMGLIFGSFSFVFPGAWNALTHSLMGSLVLLFPYVLVLLYWMVTKLREKDREWFDEKQRLDVGKSALLTLVITTLLMILLFFVSFQNYGGVVRINWFPLYLFSVIFLFSLGTIYYSSRS